MEAKRLVEELLNLSCKWHKIPVSVKAHAVILYFKGLSLRKVRDFLATHGWHVSMEAIREWYHSLSKLLSAIYFYACWAYVDETKIKGRRKHYYLRQRTMVCKGCKGAWFCLGA